MMSSSGIKGKVPRPSNLQQINANEVDLVQLKERFDKQLPKYGFLWRSLNNARLLREAKDNDDSQGIKPTASKATKVAVDEDKENNNITRASLQRQNNEKLHDDDEQPNLLNAILNKQPVTLRVQSSNNEHELLCGEDCNCAEPIIEIDNEDEDASVYDVDVDEELADTDDERNMSNDSEKSTNVNNMDGNLDEGGVEIDIEDSLSSSDDSILVISKTPKKKKMFIIDSDDESEVEDGREDEESENGSVKKIEEKSLRSDDSAPTSASKRSTHSRLRNSKRAATKSKPLEIMDDDDEFKSTSSEEEWIELSSDEEEDIQNNKNTVVILDDDEADKSEDHHSTFTISSDDSDNSSDDESGVKFRKTTKSKRHENKKTSSGGQRPTTKPAAKRKPNTKHNQTKSRSKATAFSKNRDTLTSHTFSEFNLKAFEGALSSVTVTWSNKLNTTAGITRMRGKLGKDNAHTRVATIELATKVIDNEERLRSTLLHEMCHAAQWLVDGIHKPPHGAQFKKWANISMRKIRDVEVTTTHDYQISYKYAWVSA